MRAAVVVFPGSNADAEMLRTLRQVLQIDTSVVFHKERELPSGTDLVVIPGGFAHGDYLRAGALAKASPISQDLARHAERGGLLLGVCNGFQILTEMGLLPGALTRNSGLRFECREVRVSAVATGPFTAGLEGTVLRLPIAHAEGRYWAAPSELDLLDAQASKPEGEAVAFRYVDLDGKPTLSANPNGSERSIAGVYNKTRNVLGLMPHPERMSEPLHGGTDGRLLFEAVVRSARARATGGAA